jgi:hypothetical protein
MQIPAAMLDRMNPASVSMAQQAIGGRWTWLFTSRRMMPEDGGTLWRTSADTPVAGKEKPCQGDGTMKATTFLSSASRATILAASSLDTLAGATLMR